MTKPSIFASRIDFREIVAKLTKLPRRLFVSPCSALALTLAAQSSPRACQVEQSRNNVRAKSLCFPAFARKHCSIDLKFSFARGAPATALNRRGALVYDHLGRQGSQLSEF